MVNRGPARGCQKCKDRHVKCDLLRPVCRQCSKLGFTCPGYGHDLDLVLRDQTASVRAKNQKTKPKKSAAEPNERANQVISLPRIPAPDFEAVALDFLFSTVIFKPARDWRTSHGHLDLIMPFYQNAPIGSPLAHAVSWLAVMMMGTCSKGKPYALESGLFGRVTNSVRKAIADPIESVKDETLSAVMILQYGSFFLLQGHDAKIKTSEIHQNGAEALVRKRGNLNFRDNNALTLFAAIRNNAVDLALHTGERTMNWDLWDFKYDVETLGQMYTPAMELDTHGVTLVALRKELKDLSLAPDPNKTNTLREKLSELLSHLYLWEYQVLERLSGKPSHCQHRYPSQDTAYLFAQYYLLRLETIHLIQEFNMKTNTPDRSGIQSVFAMESMKQIMACQSSLVDSDMATEDQAGTEQFSVISKTNTPHAISRQPLRKGKGSYLFEQILIRLENNLSKALEMLDIPDHVVGYYHNCLNWAKREQQMIGSQYTWSKFHVKYAN